MGCFLFHRWKYVYRNVGIEYYRICGKCGLCQHGFFDDGGVDWRDCSLTDIQEHLRGIQMAEEHARQKERKDSEEKRKALDFLKSYEEEKRRKKKSWEPHLFPERNSIRMALTHLQRR